MRNHNSTDEPQSTSAEREVSPGSEDSAETQQPSSAKPPEQDAALKSVTAERDALLDRMARTQAEFENSRKRDAKEKEEFREYALADALKSLLPALDSFDWALQAPTQSLDEFRSGVELIRRQLHDSLSKLGLAQISAKGEPFNPRLHEAVDTVEAEGAQDNQVLDEVQRGYRLGSRLLRPAMVVVGRMPAEKR